MTSGDGASLQIETSSDPASVVLAGACTIRTVSALEARLRHLDPSSRLSVDLGGVTRLDTAGAWSLASLEQRAEAAGGQLDIREATPEMRAILRSVTDAMPKPETAPEAHVTLADRIERMGRAVAGGTGAVLGFAGYLGLFLSRLSRSLTHPREFRMTSLVHHCQEVGVKAVPIVALMAFLIGVVLAFQGAVQLRQFGAEVFVVDLIAVSVLRELGILLTAIIVAGRTASAFTAAIGSMKMREEIDAMRTLGLDPGMVLFVPRILALFLMLPILGLIANVAGLFGGALMSWIELGISPAMFRTRLIEGTDASHLMVGLVKAPVFALIIGVVGCRAGMQVKSNAESLGQQTSKSVVAAIFAVIVADALFSIFFAELGV
ncbi:MlaE family lipid ABC transporter permease subunit [Roseibacterium sp. SDUM158017]|uniref:ABC transporter permease n=1 Tax=Roseicyclus salinarum TaxID=3036773 RepID=UPI002414D2A9|nr:MlaE family lipid ABC transporter permease subunit [Roseibacterium sp. SDUM158017]MDG4648522.1 MlaE family lipid ABC transporter permease subunit [Roseibacterium sp. SDUM158017]